MNEIVHEACFKGTSKDYLETQLTELYQEIRGGIYHSIMDESLKMAFFAHYQGRFLKMFREHCSLSISAASNRAGISQEFAKSIEFGEVVPNVEVTIAYLGVVGASLHIDHFLELFQP